MKLALVLLVGCGASVPPIALTEQCPAQPSSEYDAVTEAWTRKDKKQDVYQEVISVVGIFKSPDWRAAHALRDAENRRLTGDARNQVLQQACADMAGPYEFEVLLTTWDRRENDLDRGERAAWHPALIDASGHEIKPLEILKDKRPAFTVRADFPLFGDFATAYIVRFPRPAEGQQAVLGPSVRQLKLVLSSSRGSVAMVWNAP